MQINITNGILIQIEEILIPSSGHKLPSSIITTGASNNYSSSSGVITMSSLISPIEIIAEGEQIIPDITFWNLPIKKVYFGTQEVSSLSFGNIEIWKAWPKQILVDSIEKALLTSDGKFMKTLTVDPVLENNDWDTIKTVALLNKTSSFWSVGDTKTDIGTNGVTRTFRIVNIEQDGSIVFEEVGLEDPVKWNATNNSNYYQSDIRNTHLPATILKFSESLQNNIATSNIIVATGGTDGTLLTLTDKLFLEAEKEIGSDHYSRSEERAILNIFAYYIIHNSTYDRIKYRRNQPYASNWSLRSSYNNISNKICDVRSDNGSIIDSISSNNEYFAPCFRIGSDQTGGLGPYVPSDPVLNNNSWAKIREVCEAGEAGNYWSVGDTKSDVGTDGTTRTFRIVDMSGLYGKHVVFEQVELEGIDSSSTNGVIWNNNENNNYSTSDMNTTILPNIITKYSNDLQNNLTNTTVKVAEEGSYGASVIEVTNKLFLAAEKEIFGNNGVGVSNEASVLTRYNYYTIYDQLDYRIKYKNSMGLSWWLRSPSPLVSGYICLVVLDGNVGVDICNHDYCFAPCFAF